ncbi:MAG: hypothetical protein Q8P41_06980, partial [Pseudomonadota bacterium]|nr:hypothetical protein [Pseudomonadota bacterium]
MANPTVLLGVGPFGESVLQRIESSLSGDDALICRLATPAAEAGARLVPVLEDLLQAGRFATEQSERRLDLIAFVHVLAGGDDDLIVFTEQVTRVVHDRYRVMFDLSRPPEQRNAGLHLVIVLPPLGDTDVARRALDRVYKLERWAAGLDPARGTPPPLLARIWLLSQMTLSGPLSSSIVLASCAAFAVALVGSGLRQSEPVSRRLAHLPPGEPKVAFFSVASLDVPEARIRDYAIQRAAYDALTTLVARVQARPVTDPAEGLAAVRSLEHQEWVRPFEDTSEAAVRARALAASLGGAAMGLPDNVRVGPFEEGERIRERYAVLFAPATQDRTLTGVDQGQLEALLRHLDNEEAKIVRDLHGRIAGLFGGHLRRESLKPLLEIELGLKQVAAQLRDQQTRVGLLGAGPDGPPPDPHRAELEAAVAALPAPGLVRTGAAAVGIAVGGLATVGLTGWSHAAAAPTPSTGPMPQHQIAAPPTTGTTAPVSAIDWREELPPWAAGAAIGLLVAIGWGWLAGNLVRQRVRALLTARTQALRAIWSKGGGGRTSRQADDQLELRRHRVRRAALLAVEGALARVTAMQLTIAGARDRSRQALVAMGVPPAADAALDDLSGLVGEPDLLHGPLLPPRYVSQWVGRCREASDPEVWASRLLTAAWPPDSAEPDVPCGDPAPIDAASRDQVRSLGTRSLLADEPAQEAAGRAIADFLARTAAALAPPVTARDENGDPVGGLRAGEALAVAPRIAADPIERALRDAPLRLTPLWTDRQAPRAIFLRTWEGYRVLDVARGAGTVPPGTRGDSGGVQRDP